MVEGNRTVWPRKLRQDLRFCGFIFQARAPTGGREGAGHRDDGLEAEGWARAGGGVLLSLMSRKRTLGSQPLARRPRPCSSQPHTPSFPFAPCLRKPKGHIQLSQTCFKHPSISKTAVQTAVHPRSGGDGPGLPSSALGPSCLSWAALAMTLARKVRRDTWDSRVGDSFAKDESSFFVSYKSIARVLVRPDNSLCARSHGRGTFSSSSTCRMNSYWLRSSAS